MSIPIRSNRYPFPPGYTAYPSVAIPWNGGLSSLNSPGAALQGGSLNIEAVTVPADLSTLAFFNNSTEILYTLQFVYNASVPTAGITVNLPNSGLSTAAEVGLQIQLALNAAFGLTFDNEVVPFPWEVLHPTPETVILNFNVPGPWSVSVTPAGIETTADNTTQVLSVSNGVVPGRVGRLSAFLPGPV